MKSVIFTKLTQSDGKECYIDPNAVFMISDGPSGTLTNIESISGRQVTVRGTTEQVLELLTVAIVHINEASMQSIVGVLSAETEEEGNNN